MREWIAATMLLMAAGCSGGGDPPLKAGERVVLVSSDGHETFGVWVRHPDQDDEMAEPAVAGAEAIVIKDQEPDAGSVRVSIKQGPYIGPARVLSTRVRRIR